MSNFSTKRGYMVAMVLFIIFVFLLMSLLYDPVLATHIFVPLVLFLLASFNFYKGRRRIQSGEIPRERIKWYQQCNIIHAIAWICAFLNFPIYYFVPDQRYIGVKDVIMGILVFATIVLLVYGIYLQWCKNDS